MSYKKGISLGLALSMFLGSSAAALTPGEGLVKGNDEVLKLQKQLEEEYQLQKLKESDTVRIIVELDGEAVIEKATSKNVRLIDMSEKEIKKAQKAVLSEQASVQKKITSKGVKFEVLNNFTNVANGFSLETTLAGAKKIELLDGVKSVTIANEYERPEPDMVSSGEITETFEAWANGYNGEGTVIAILDTGIDSGHRDMVLTDASKAELDKSEVDSLVKDKNLSGKFYTDKVPYGYNYMDGNFEIRDLGPDASEHGMHVAGIAGANGDVEKDGIKGTAPEAQLLAMKVFGNNPAMSSTFGDVIIKAIDDSVLLGADVINMSLGSSSAYVNDEDPEQAAVNRAVDNGVLVSVSSGNSNVFADGYDNPYPQNPDYGVVGAPGIATDSLQVASIENNLATGNGVEFAVDGKNLIYPYTTAGTDILTILKNKNLKLVDCGIGEANEIPAEVKGNVALIKRGVIAFTDKITNAANNGAVAVIVYNNEGGGDELINMMYPEGYSIPAVFVGYTAGSTMQKSITNKDFTVAFKGNVVSAPNSKAGKMADSTSWGVTPNFELKPEITGVGGNVWSTANDNKYQNMSGTSMAAPNVAGGSALVLQRVDELFNLKGEDRIFMAKNILMSTAIAHVDNGAYQQYAVVAGENYTSPRRQGAGVMNLAGATKTNAIVTDSETGICKVNLKEIKGDKATFTIKVNNFGDKAITYDLNGTVQTDLADEEYNYLQAQNLIDAETEKFPISFSKNSVTVPAKANAEVTVTVDLSNAVTAYDNKKIEEVFVNGGFVDGFVTLTDPTDNNPQLSIPYVGFKGEWDKAPTLDGSIYDKESPIFYGQTGMVADSAEGMYYMGVPYDAEDEYEANGDYIDFSPNGDGQADFVLPRLSYLRNIKNMEVQILDAKGNVIRTLDTSENIRKHFYDSGKTATSTFLESGIWDGTANGKLVEDGTYTYRIRTIIDFEGAEWQTYDFKVNVDTKAPEIKSEAYDKNTKKLTITAEDNMAGHIFSYALTTPMVDENGEQVVLENSNGIFDLSDVVAAGYSYEECIINVTDYALNSTAINFGEPTGAEKGDKTAPVVFVDTPEFFGTSNSNEVVIAGRVQDVSAIKEFTINGEEVELSYSALDKVWLFEHMVTLENGYHSIYINSKDAAGNELGFAHKIFVDSEAPVLNLQDVPVMAADNKVIIKGTASDNFPDLKIVINGDVKENIVGEWEYFDTQKPASTELNYEVQLVNGENTITVEAYDGAGNVTVQEYYVTKVDEMNIKIEKVVGTSRYSTAVEVSKKGWDKSNYAVLANGVAFADALVSGPLAAQYDAPILLTEKDKLTTETANELKRLGTKVVFVVGGTGVVSTKVETALQGMGIEVVRFSGENRYATSLALAKYLDKDINLDTIYVANGNLPADAVSISSKATMDKAPIVLVDKNQVLPETLSWIKEKGISNAYVIGGTAAISDNVLKALDGVITADITGNRIAGANRFDTNAAVIEKFFGKYAENVMVTESKTLVDALVVAPFAAKTGAPIVITTDKLTTAQSNVLDSMVSSNLVQIGGGVNSKVLQDIATRLNK